MSDSALLPKMLTACTASGASSDDVTVRVPEPMCMATAVPVSAHAAKNGSQYPEWIDGSPNHGGSSENATARTPRAALRRTSAAASSASHSGTRHNGMSRPWEPAHHSSTCQSLYASTHSFESSLSFPFRKICPQKRG